MEADLNLAELCLVKRVGTFPGFGGSGLARGDLRKDFAAAANFLPTSDSKLELMVAIERRDHALCLHCHCLISDGFKGFEQRA